MARPEPLRRTMPPHTTRTKTKTSVATKSPPRGERGATTGAGDAAAGGGANEARGFVSSGAFPRNVARRARTGATAARSANDGNRVEVLGRRRRRDGPLERLVERLVAPRIVRGLLPEFEAREEI